MKAFPVACIIMQFIACAVLAQCGQMFLAGMTLAFALSIIVLESTDHWRRA